MSSLEVADKFYLLGLETARDLVETYIKCELDPIEELNKFISEKKKEKADE